MTFTQKETGLLGDLRSEEQLCIDKYTRYASSACDVDLKALLTSIADVERGHLKTIDSLMSGSLPSMSGSSGSSNPSIGGSYTTPSSQVGECFTNDKYLTSDLLSTEKFVSSVYDTCIFEFKDSQVRNILNHIQKEEQGHGEQIYNYMAKNGMYN